MSYPHRSQEVADSQEIVEEGVCCRPESRRVVLVHMSWRLRIFRIIFGIQAMQQVGILFHGLRRSRFEQVAHKMRNVLQHPDEIDMRIVSSHLACVLIRQNLKKACSLRFTMALSTARAERRDRRTVGSFS